jgi:hypothetical protein
MCGIFGLFVDKQAGFTSEFIGKSLKTLALLSESRGKDSSGLVFRDEAGRTLSVFKGAVSISCLLKQREISQEIHKAIDLANSGSSVGPQGVFAAMGHSRLVTNGSQLQDVNNQPVVKDGVVGIHNGIIVNEAQLWSRYPVLRRSFEIDTEIMLSMVSHFAEKGGDLASAVSRTVREICGTVSSVMYVGALDQFALVTNNGSLYVLTNQTSLLAFASEGYFLRELAKSMPWDKGQGELRMHQVIPGTGLIVDMDAFRIQEFSMAAIKEKSRVDASPKPTFRIEVHSITDGGPQREVILDVAQISRQPRAKTEAALLEYNLERIQALKRCMKCLLPESFPFIEFDDRGICNYCNNYKLKNQPKPIEQLSELVNPYRSHDRSPDCIIPYSGGRDSTYTLHIVKKVLKLNPITFTYDWGMVTDLGRRNIARVCGKLGVENIIISADIRKKRKNIRSNILAWLRKPHLGMVPLFMAGDKFFFYYTAKVKKQTGIRLNIWGINPLENTEFKVGFMGVSPNFNKKRIYSLSAKRQAKLFIELGRIFLGNSAYLNPSIMDSLGSYASRYFIKHRDYYHMYDYVRWDEKEIEKLILNEYDWETAVDTQTTWRIGDGTAAFYNYIYYTVAGFSEYDTFRSNQIREGMISREEGLRLVTTENQPRYPSIKWYTEIIGLDFASTITQINKIPKLYG